MPGRGRGRPALPPEQRKPSKASTAEWRLNKQADKGMELYNKDERDRKKLEKEKVRIDRLS